MSTYFLAPKKNDPSGGSDSNFGGTITSPWFTWEKVWQVLKPGDIVECRGGKYEYDKGQYLGNKNGTAALPITIRAYQSELPVFTKSASYPSTEQDLIFIESMDWFRFTKLEFTGLPQFQGKSAWPALRIQQGNNNIFDQINYHKNGSGMSFRGNSSNNLFNNSDFHENQDPYSSDKYGGADGLDLHEITGTNNVVRGCRFWWNSDDGLDMWWNEGHVLVENCWSFYNGYIPGSFNPAGDGGGYKLGETQGEYYSTVKRTIKNCLAYKNRKYAISENNLKAKSLVENFTAVQHGNLGFYVGQWDPRAIMTIKNSINYKGPHDIPPHVIQTNNSWQDGNIVTDGSFVSLDDTQLLKPRKADGSLPDLTFLKVTGPDLAGQGAVFYSGAVTPPPPPPGDVIVPCSIIYYDNLSLKRIAVSSFVQKSDGNYINGTKRDIIYYKDANGKWRFL